MTSLAVKNSRKRQLSESTPPVSFVKDQLLLLGGRLSWQWKDKGHDIRIMGKRLFITSLLMSFLGQAWGIVLAILSGDKDVSQHQ